MKLSPQSFLGLKCFRSGPAQTTAHGREVRARGIALIITLIMLSVITFMAITFLVLSHRERNSVSTTTDQTSARFAADSALERAKAEIIGRMLAFTNDQGFRFTVSTNYINWNGLTGFQDPTNVNYQYLANGNVLSANALLTNIANLWYDPRPPVIVSNYMTGSNEFRFYLDLNRNGRYDTNGWWPVMSDNPSLPYYDPSGNLTANLNNAAYANMTGDPEWIGVLTRPDLPHSGSNYFVSRYAYYVQPLGTTLDVNAIHNQAFTRQLNAGNDGYLRNQGVGSWEINLAAFLADLNTNYWYTNDNVPLAVSGAPYRYRQPLNVNDGAAFADALGFLSYRYAGNYNTLRRADQIFADSAVPLQWDNIDEYSDGVRRTNDSVIEAVGYFPDQVNLPWAGADNTNHFFNPQEFFDDNEVKPMDLVGFVKRIKDAGTHTNTYDQFTYYRLLAQLGTESSPLDDRLNVNYVNVGADGKTISGMETNLILWTPAQFFTNAAQRMFEQLNLRDYAGNLICVTNIPIYYPVTNSTTAAVYNYYTPAVHRILQLAANIYDATTNRNDNASPPNPYLPSVFRPYFRSANGVVSIAGYAEVIDTVPLSYTYYEPTNILINYPNQLLSFANVYGVPWVIGARKGLPNFNKCVVENQIKVTRRLWFHRNTNEPVNRTNQAYSLSISNTVAIQAWNSYAMAFPRKLSMIASGEVSLMLTNEFGNILGPDNYPLNSVRTFSSVSNIAAGTWTGYPLNASFSPQYSFKLPVMTNYWFLTNNSYYRQTGNSSSTRFIPSNQAAYDAPNQYLLPRWFLRSRARLNFILIDTSVSPNRIVDYVNLEYEEPATNIIQVVRGGPNVDCSGNIQSDSDAGFLWCTNRYGDAQGSLNLTNAAVPTYGIINQIKVASGAQYVDRDIWGEFSTSSQTERSDQASRFAARLFGKGVVGDVQNNDFQSPFTPTRTIYQYPISWEANDPLVHYTVSDLLDQVIHPSNLDLDDNTHSPLRVLASSNPGNSRYLPWGGMPTSGQDSESDLSDSDAAAQTQFNPGVKDPLVTRSDFWNFPTNKLPNIGWLGRVHRGTPWQTVYMKAWGVDTNIWSKWTGNLSWNYASSNYDVWLTTPTNDYALFDLFTATPNQNASRGRLSVNQDGLAAWSAILSGLMVLTNGSAAPGSYDPIVIDPAGIYSPTALSPVAEIVAGINRTRTNIDARIGPVFAGGTFHHIGDILAVPELSSGRYVGTYPASGYWTNKSPYLDLGVNANSTQATKTIGDDVFERIPQQIMGLLAIEHTPRFAIYSYGQTLHPADHSVVLANGPFSKLCTNYQVTAEVATRAVVRIEGSPDPQYTNDPVHPYPDSNGQFYPPRIVVEQFNVLPPD